MQSGLKLAGLEPAGLEPAALAYDADGHPVNTRYGDAYATRAGALGQARHVFLAGNDLPARWAGREQFTVVETGFGLGVNFLATWAAWRADASRPRRLHYLAFEAHPVVAADLLRLAPPEFEPLARELAASWPLPLGGLHRLELAGGAIRLTLALGDARRLAPNVVAGADAFYLDGFAPDRNPELWEPALVRALARMARPGATAATWCVARSVRDALTAAGFEIALRPGFAHKREMLVARFAPRWTVRRHEPPAPYAGERRALVVGAGLAGATVAAALAARGWRVQVFEAGAGPAAGASALPWGLLHPHLAADDNRLSRLTRAGFLTGWQRLEASGNPQLWQASGVFQQAEDDAQAGGWQSALAGLGLPQNWARWIDAPEAARRLGVAPRRGGLWFERGGLVSSRRWCEQLLATVGVDLYTDCAVQRIERTPDGWRVYGSACGRASASHAAGGRGAGRGAASGQGVAGSVARDHGVACGAAAVPRASKDCLLATAPVLVVANALAASGLLGLAHAPMAAVRGRISLLAAPALHGLVAGLTGDGYLVRGPDGFLGIGASYEPATSGVPALDAAAVHAENLARLARLLAAPTQARVVGMFDGERCVAHDRLPLAGAVADEAAALARAADLRGAHLDDLPRVPDLYGSFALGSRGLTLAPLAAELIAARIEGEPWPVERDLAAAVDPARFLLRHLRAGTAA